MDAMATPGGKAGKAGKAGIMAWWSDAFNWLRIAFGSHPKTIPWGNLPMTVFKAAIARFHGTSMAD